MPLPRLPLLRPTHRRFCAALAALTLLADCAQVPELDATVPAHLEDADYPALIPLDGSIATQTLPVDAASDIENSLAARRDRLQARAKQLNAPIVDAKAEARMKAGISR